MHKTNLLFIITKLELGGAQKQLINLITHLDRGRFVPILFTAKEGFLVSEAKSFFLHLPFILIYDIFVFTYLLVRRRSLFKRLFFLPAALLALKNNCK